MGCPASGRADRRAGPDEIRLNEIAGSRYAEKDDLLDAQHPKMGEAMSDNARKMQRAPNRRDWLAMTALGLAGTTSRAAGPQPVSQAPAANRGEPTRFQIACMTLPYSRFPLDRALTGIKAAGYDCVAWGTTHKDGALQVPVIAAEAPPVQAKELGKKCRDLGLEPLMMFSGIYPEAPGALDIMKGRIRQAAAGGLPQLLTFGHTRGGNRKLWIARFKELGPVARDHGVTIVIKQHGGETGTGAACADIVREVGDEGVKVNYDAGNVMDYLDVDPIPDIRACADLVHGFCIKDHRNFPKDEDCGPGFGVIDHYRLLEPVAFTGRKMPLCCENISAPVIPPPTDPGRIDDLARRAREFLEVVTRGLQV
jgi:sugar phosphate isomerase/epimerase